MRLHLSRRRRITLRVRRRSRYRGGAITRRNELLQVADKVIGRWRTQARGGIPARARIKARHSIEGVVAAGHVEQIRGIAALGLTDMVERPVDKAQVPSRILIGNRRDGRPLR